MEVSEEKLKKIIEAVLEEKEPKKVYLFCENKWNDQHRQTLRYLDVANEYKVTIIASSMQLKYENEWNNYSCYEGYIDWMDLKEPPIHLNSSITIFPEVSRNLVVKTALCIADDVKTTWIADCIEEGSRIIFLKSGLKQFLGFEQEAYQNQILKYYKQILEYGIEICDIKTFLSKK